MTAFNHRKLLITYGSDLDHSNMNDRVHKLLKPFEGPAQKDYDFPVLRKGSEFILNYETFDTNPNKPFESYYGADYHLTQAQLDGFLYTLGKLKGTHILGHPHIRGHAEVKRGTIEFQFLVTRTLEQQSPYVYYPSQNEEADKLMQTLIPLLPPDERHLLMAADDLEETKQKRLEDWVDRALSSR